MATEIWRQIFAFFMATRPKRDLVLERLDLTPNDARAFSSLHETDGRTMRSLADEWGYVRESSGTTVWFRLAA